MYWRLSPSFAVAALLLAACSAPPPYAKVARPSGVERAQRAHRAGHVFYWVEDRWYVQSGEEWYAYPPPVQPMNTWMWRR